MIAINSLPQFEPERFRYIVSGYSTSEIYRVTHSERDDLIRFDLILESLEKSLLFQFPFIDEDMDRYASLVPAEYCLGVFDGGELVGIALAEPQWWNGTLWVWEFHVAAEYRGRGLGHRLMNALIGRARASKLRAIVCETQNTNVPAIRFYRAVGFHMEGVDISYYTNEDMSPGGTVAVFMKLRLE